MFRFVKMMASLSVTPHNEIEAAHCHHLKIRCYTTWFLWLTQKYWCLLGRYLIATNAGGCGTCNCQVSYLIYILVLRKKSLTVTSTLFSNAKETFSVHQ